MFRYDEEIADETILNEGFNLSQLFILRYELNLIIEDLEKVKDLSISIRDLKELKDTEKRLYFIYRNVEIVEQIMLEKEDDIFEFLVCDEFCLN